MQEYVWSIFDRDYHYMDQMFHKDTLSAHETEFRRDISDWLVNLTPEDAFKRVKSKRNDFIAHPYTTASTPSCCGTAICMGGTS